MKLKFIRFRFEFCNKLFSEFSQVMTTTMMMMMAQQTAASAVGVDDEDIVEPNIKQFMLPSVCAGRERTMHAKNPSDTFRFVQTNEIKIINFQVRNNLTKFLLLLNVTQW